MNNYEWHYLQQLKTAQETGNETLTEWQAELLEQSKDFTQKDIADRLKNKKYPELMQVHPRRILFLNFNYTRTDRPYHGYVHSWSDSEPNSIYIHGLLNDKDNPIIFGYGDELDENYKELERANDNLFLQNIKSVRYLFTNLFDIFLQTTILACQHSQSPPPIKYMCSGIPAEIPTAPCSTIFSNIPIVYR